MQSRSSACMVGAAPKGTSLIIMEGQDDSQSRSDLEASAGLSMGTKEPPLYGLLGKYRTL